jgi:hypothetical protein
VAPAGGGRALLLASLAGALAALIILALWLGFQPLSAAVRARWFWMKAGYALALAVAGYLMLTPLARPGARIGRAGGMVAGVTLVMMASMAIWRLVDAPPGAAMGLWLGQSWMVCPWRILALAIPVFIGLILGLRRLAPTQLRLAGAAAGLLAGAVAALVYGLYCEESSAAFVATWYTLGVTACALFGALVGPNALRW